MTGATITDKSKKFRMTGAAAFSSTSDRAVAISAPQEKTKRRDTHDSLLNLSVFRIQTKTMIMGRKAKGSNSRIIMVILWVSAYLSRVLQMLPDSSKAP